MFLSILRVLFGFLVAALAAGAVQLAFAMPNDVLTDDIYRLASAAEHAALTATHSGVFAAPFALVAAAIGEWQSIRSWVYYALSGIAIAIAGFIALYSGEATGQPTIVNNYALAAFLSAGLTGGMTYWSLAGRWAGEPLEPTHRMRSPYNNA
jgi:hypothetical protein